MPGASKLAVIVHRWGGSPESDWYPWLRAELVQRGYDVLVPAMPNPNEPVITPWVDALSQLLAEHPSEQTLLVGHSVGCQTILRALANRQQTVQKALFVAGWVRLTGLEDEDQIIAEPWLTQAIDVAAAKARLGASVAIFSEDDPVVPLSNQDFFRDQIGSQIVLLDGYGHFDEETDTSEIPELLAYV